MAHVIVDIEICPLRKKSLKKFFIYKAKVQTENNCKVHCGAQKEI